MADLSSSEAPAKKRRRPALSCEQCRKRKVRCDRSSPCNNCIKSQNANCSYVEVHTPKAKVMKPSDPTPPLLPRPPPPPQTNSHSVPRQFYELHRENGSGFDFNQSPRSSRDTVPPGTVPPLSRSASTLPNTPSGAASSASNIEFLTAKVKQLEKKLAETTGNTSSVDDTHRKPPDVDWPLCATIKGSMNKTRYFGESHWMNGAAMFPLQIKLLGQAELAQGELYHLMSQSKTIARQLKQSRMRPFSHGALGRSFPSRELADQLIENYLGTFEGILRIVHIPTFRADYERYWQNPDAASDALIVQLQLCMSLGTMVRQDSLSLKSMATGWVYEAEMWLITPPEKTRMTLVGIQTMCLLLWAKTVVGVGADLTWVLAGSTVRRAMYMGLHRDPKYLGQMTRYRAEMRRRLWATILELNVQLSFDAGGLPLLNSLNYDTEPPSNLNDDELTDENEPEDGSRAPDENRETQTTMQIALLKSLSLRVRLLDHINDFRSTQSYDSTLEFNGELMKACRQFSQDVKSAQNGSSQYITSFHRTVGEVFLHRYFNSLHIPILTKSFSDPRTYFSRRICLDNALKIAHMWGFTEKENSGKEISPEFRRLVVTGAGMFRNVPVQAWFIVCLELFDAQESEDTGLGYLPGLQRADYTGMIYAIQNWCTERLRAGETSAKGHCFVSACAAYMEALDKHLSQEATESLIIQRATDSARFTLEILKDVARNNGIVVASPDNVENAAMQDGMASLESDWQSNWAWDDADGLPSWWQLQVPVAGVDINGFFGEPFL